MYVLKLQAFPLVENKKSQCKKIYIFKLITVHNQELSFYWPFTFCSLSSFVPYYSLNVSLNAYMMRHWLSLL